MRGLTAEGRRIRELRALRGFTQEHLAAAASVDVRTIRRAESSSSIDVATLRSLALALSVNLSEIAARAEGDGLLEEEANLESVRQWQAAFDRRDVETIVALYRDDAVLRYPPPVGECAGRAAIRELVECAFAEFDTDPIPPERYRIDAAADYVFLRARARATIRSTGAAFEAEGMHEFRFDAGEIVLHVHTFDMKSLLDVSPPTTWDAIKDRSA